MLRLAAALCALAALCVSANAAQAAETLRLGEYPSPAWLHSAASMEAELFPDYERAFLYDFSYTETTQRRRLTGVLTLRPAQRAYAAVLHYSPQGTVSLLRRAQRVEPDQLITLTFPLPPRSGLTRLLLLAEPDPRRLLQLAQYPNLLGTPAPGVLHQRWLQRGRSEALADLPWERSFARPDADWPLVSAQLGERLLPLCKDCALVTGAAGELRAEAFGLRPQWRIGPGATLALHFELAELPPRAQLRVTAGAAAASLELHVNGTRVTAAAPFGTDAGQLGWDVAPYLREGRNVIELSVPLHGADIYIARVEIRE